MSLADRLHLHRFRDPDRPRVPMGGSRNEAIALFLTVVVVVALAVSFWVQATR